MDVRCDRCQTEYELDDESLAGGGASVQCTSCGHTFVVGRDRGGVTPGPVPTPGPTTSSWMLTTEEGKTHRFRDPTTLQKWVVERRVGRTDRVCPPGGAGDAWGTLDELRPFFDVVDQADRAAAAARVARPTRPETPRTPRGAQCLRLPRRGRRRHSHQQPSPTPVGGERELCDAHSGRRSGGGWPGAPGTADATWRSAWSSCSGSWRRTWDSRARPEFGPGACPTRPPSRCRVRRRRRRRQLQRRRRSRRHHRRRLQCPVPRPCLSSRPPRRARSGADRRGPRCAPTRRTARSTERAGLVGAARWPTGRRGGATEELPAVGLRRGSCP